MTDVTPHPPGVESGVPAPVDVDARVTTVPYLAALVGVPAVLAHAFALAGLVGGWSRYSSPLSCVGLFVVSAALPAALVVCQRVRRDGCPPAVPVLVEAGLVVVSVGVCALLPPDLRSSWQSWNWGTAGMTLLGLAALVPLRRVVVGALLHAAVGGVVQVLSGGDAWRVLVVAVAVLVSPLGAAQYLRFYAEALRRRSLATRSRVLAETERGELEEVRLAEIRRLAALREETGSLLARVAAGARLPLDAEHAAKAADLSVRLRAALAAERATQWLPERVGSAPVDVQCSPAAGGSLPAVDRAWVAAVLDVLGAHPGWRAIRVVLDVPSPRRARVRGRRAVTRAVPPRPRTSAAATARTGPVAVVVTAQGPAAAAAAASAALRILARERGARVTTEVDVLSVDADLRRTMEA